MLPDPRPYFAELADPRRATKNKPHPLQDILMTVFCAVLSGVEDRVGMEAFAREKEAWFRQFLELPNGVPSHDTPGDVVGRLAPGVFAAAFLRWAQPALPALSGERVCLDGKTLRGSRGQNGAVHLLNACAAKARLVLAQQAVDGKSNEATAIPQVLDLPGLQGTVVSLDAMGRQKAVAGKVSQAGADHVLALKDNHPQLREDVPCGWTRRRPGARWRCTRRWRKTAGASKSAVTCSATSRTGWRRSRSGRACRPWGGWNRRASSATRPPPNAATA